MKTSSPPQDVHTGLVLAAAYQNLAEQSVRDCDSVTIWVEYSRAGATGYPRIAWNWRAASQDDLNPDFSPPPTTTNGVMLSGGTFVPAEFDLGPTAATIAYVLPPLDVPDGANKLIVRAKEIGDLAFPGTLAVWVSTGKE